MVILFSIIALFGLYSIFVAILLIVTGKYSKRWMAAIIALITAMMQIVIPVSAYCLSRHGILSDDMTWFSVGLLLGLNYLVFHLWGRIRY
mgnify:CR=1 FL=1